MSPRLKIQLRLQRNLCPHLSHPSILAELVHGITRFTYPQGRKKTQLYQGKPSALLSPRSELRGADIETPASSRKLKACEEESGSYNMTLRKNHGSI
ncbi:hypothetical protein Nmel_000260 [Mimus melanotis]